MKLLIFLMFTYILFIPSAWAETLRVGYDGSLDEERLELESGKTGNIEVILKSEGRPVSGYRIALVTHSDSRILSTEVSEENGVIRFLNVAPQRYKIKIVTVPKKQSEDLVRIGDIILTPHLELK